MTPDRTCPRCGGKKSWGARQCHDCKSRDQVGKPAPRRGKFSDDAVHAIARRESIITFRDRESGRIKTLRCVGKNEPGQIEDGLLQLPLGEWVVECRSTPHSILTDLGRSAP